MTSRSYRDSDTVDFVIVGSGAAGGVLARELTRANHSVVVLEQGPRVWPSDLEHDELKNWFLGGLATTNPQTFRRSAAETAVAPVVRPPLFYARVVGGSTQHFTANFWRFHEIDFNERSVLGPIAGTTFADWPISYAELEPYYTRVDWDIGVSGDAAANPFEPPTTRA